MTDPVAGTVDGSIVAVTTTGTFIAVPSPPDEFQFSFDPDSFPVFSASVAGDTNPDLLR